MLLVGFVSLKVAGCPSLSDRMGTSEYEITPCDDFDWTDPVTTGLICAFAESAKMHFSCHKSSARIGRYIIMSVSLKAITCPSLVVVTRHRIQRKPKKVACLVEACRVVCPDVC